MDIDDLRGFLAVARSRNLTRAAQSLGLSQPTLSRRIQRLESSLGQPLFERTSREMVLTDAGSRFIDRARRIVGMLDDAAAEFADDPDTGLVRIGAIPTIAPYFLPGVISAFSAEYPDARVRVTEETTDKLLVACREGAIDIAILARPIDAAHLEAEDLFEDELLLVTAPTHPLARSARVPIGKIDSEPMVLLNSEHCLSDTVEAFCWERAVQTVTVERVHQLATLQELVALGHGVSIIPKLAADHDRTNRLAYTRLTKPSPMRTLVAVKNPYRFESHVARMLWEMLLEGDQSQR